MAGTNPKQRTVADLLEELRQHNEATARVQLAHMNMTPEERRAAEEKVEARTGSRIFHIEDLVAAHEENAPVLPAGYYLADLAEA